MYYMRQKTAKSAIETIVKKSVYWLLKRWHINRVIDQNIQKLLFFAVFTSYIASILNKATLHDLVYWLIKRIIKQNVQI